MHIKCKINNTSDTQTGQGQKWIGNPLLAIVPWLVVIMSKGKNQPVVSQSNWGWLLLRWPKSRHVLKIFWDIQKK